MSRYAIGVSWKALRRTVHVWQKQPMEGRLETRIALGLSIHNALPRIQLTNKVRLGIRWTWMRKQGRAIGIQEKA